MRLKRISEEKKMCLDVPSDLFKDNSLSVEFVCSIGGLLYLGWDGKVQGRELPDLPEQADQPV